MSFRVEFTRLSLEYLRTIPGKHQEQIIRKAESLADDPFPLGCKALKGKFAGKHRVRSGDYRIIYQVRDRELLIIVVKVGQRSQVYR
ncbi:MAG: type II toxin-antitoxin system RelE family toxin [Candidatus Methylomirabilia bacterium]